MRKNAGSKFLGGWQSIILVLLAMIGSRYLLSRGITLSFGVSYDNSNAILLRPGVTFSF
jgi:hypothetical protein